MIFKYFLPFHWLSFHFLGVPFRAQIWESPGKDSPHGWYLNLMWTVRLDEVTEGQIKKRSGPEMSYGHHNGKNLGRWGVTSSQTTSPRGPLLCISTSTMGYHLLCVWSHHQGSAQRWILVRSKVPVTEVWMIDGFSLLRGYKMKGKSRGIKKASLWWAVGRKEVSSYQRELSMSLALRGQLWWCWYHHQQHHALGSPWEGGTSF